MATYDIVQQTYNVGTETAVVWREWYALTIAEAVIMGGDDERTIIQYINDRFSELMGEGVPETFDTIKEITDYLEAHEEVSAALNDAISNKVDKVEGMGLSTNDFTNTDKDNLAIAIQSALFTNATPTPVKHGGIAAGTTFENVSVNKVLEDILYPYVKPNASITVNVTDGSGTSKTLTHTYVGDSDETTGDPIGEWYFFAAAGNPASFTIAVNATISNKNTECTANLIVSNDQNVTTEVNADTNTISITGTIAPTKDCTISLTINDGTSTVTIPVAKLMAADPVFILNDTDGIAEKTEFTADDIEITQNRIGGESTLKLTDYSNRRIVFALQNATSLILDQNGLNITHLFTTVRGVTVGDYSNCVLYISDPVTIDGTFIITVF